MPSELERYTRSCDYPGVLDELEVEHHLGLYLAALGEKRRVVRIRRGWRLEDHPSMVGYANAVLSDLLKRRDASAARAASAACAACAARDARAACTARDTFVALDARAARDASTARAARDALAASAAHDALAALDARDDAEQGYGRLRRFITWCIQRGGWWYWRWDLSLIATTWFGAKQLRRRQVERWSRPVLDAFCAGAWLLHWTSDTLYWVAKPIVRSETVNGQHRVHCEDSAAVESDIGDLYFWHGVLVPAFVVVRPDWITVEHINGEQNAEVRRMMIDRYGASRYLQDSGAKLLQQDDYGQLWHKDVPDDEPIVMVRLVNSTPEPDGSSSKVYWLRVPPGMETARQAVAWSFGIDNPEGYAPVMET